MQEIYIGNGTTEYHLHSTAEKLPSYIKRGIEGLGNPSMRIDAYDNPGIRGETIAQVLPGGSLITLEGEMRGIWSASDAEILANFENERLALAAAVTHTYNELGRAQPLTLRFTTLTGRQLQVSCFKDRYRADIDRNTRNKFFLQLRNPSGVIESQAETTATITLPKPGGVEFDLTWDIVFGDATGGFADVANAGTAEAKPIITLYGPLNTPRITNTATNEYIELDLNMLAGEVVTIDTKDDTIIQGESTNRMSARVAGSTFWALQPGTNTVTLSAVTYDTGYAEITYRDTFEGL